MAFSFNGSSLTYNGAVAEIRSMTADHQAAEIDVTNAADTVMIFETGTDNATITIEINGDSTIDVGSAGAILTVIEPPPACSVITPLLSRLPLPFQQPPR